MPASALARGMDLFDDFIADKIRFERSPATLTAYKSVLGPYVENYDLTPDSVRGYLNSKSSWCPRSKNYFLVLLRHYVRWIEDRLSEQIPEDPNRFFQWQREKALLEAVRRVGRGEYTIKVPPVRKALNVEELQNLLDATKKDYEVFMIVATLGYFGLRRSELTSLRRKWIDFKQNRLDILVSKSFPRFAFFSEKMGDLLKDAINYYRSKRGLVFDITPTTVYRKVKAWQRVVPRIKLTPHSMRFTFVTHMEGRVNDKILFRFLCGHRVPKSDMTAYYTQFSATPERVREAMVDNHFMKALRW